MSDFSSTFNEISELLQKGKAKEKASLESPSEEIAVLPAIGYAYLVCGIYVFSFFPSADR